MSLLSILTKFSVKNKGAFADVRAGFMGKIPARADFVRHHASTPEIKQIDQWIHEGIAYLARRFPADWKERIVGFNQISCYISGEGLTPAIIGVIRPSQDKSGRHHPFMEFAISSSAQVAHTLPFVALRFADFYTKSGRLRKRNGSDLDIEGLVQQNYYLCRLIPPFSETKLKQQRDKIWAGRTSAEFWEAILPAANSMQRLNFVRDVMQTLKMAANRGPERIAWGVRLPLAKGAANNALVSFWLSLFVKVLGHHKWRPHVFWNPESRSDSALTIYFRSPNASSFAQLICPEVDEGGIVDVVRRPLENLPEITNLHIKKIVESSMMSWPEMLENWTKEGV